MQGRASERSEGNKALHMVRCPACDFPLTRTNLVPGMRQNLQCPMCIKKFKKVWVWVRVVEVAEPVGDGAGEIMNVLCANCDQPLTRTNLVPGMRQNQMCPRCTRTEENVWVWVCTVAVAAPTPVGAD